MPLTVGGGIREFTDGSGRHYSALEVRRPRRLCVLCQTLPGPASSSLPPAMQAAESPHWVPAVTACRRLQALHCHCRRRSGAPPTPTGGGGVLPLGRGQGLHWQRCGVRGGGLLGTQGGEARRHGDRADQRCLWRAGARAAGRSGALAHGRGRAAPRPFLAAGACSHRPCLLASPAPTAASLHLHSDRPW